MYSFFKSCSKCNARYLFFHLDSDCKFAKEKFEFFQAILLKHYIDTKLGCSMDKQGFITIMNVILKIPYELEENCSVLDWLRIISAPVLINIATFLIGFIFIFLMGFRPIGSYSFIAYFMGYLIVLPMFLWLIWGLGLHRGGYNIFFKKMIITDLIKRYKIKSEYSSSEARFRI